MTSRQQRGKRQSYCSMIEFEQDFFPRAFSEKQVRKPTDNQSLGISMAKESFRKIRQELTTGKISE